MWDKAGGFFFFVEEGCSELDKDHIKEDLLSSAE